MKYLWINFFLLSGSLNAHATTVESYFLNREGVAKLSEKSYYPAYQNFTKALENDPWNPELHLNMGLALELNEEYEKAEQAYKGVLRILPSTSPRRFETLFNLAGVQAKQKKIGEALETYQAALELEPDSKEVKTMIELLWQGGGEGEGEGESEGEGEGQGQGKPQDEKDKGQQEKQKKQPKPFKSQNLDQQDVKKILDEIKNQEQGIRAQEYEKNAKEAPRGKDW